MKNYKLFKEKILKEKGYISDDILMNIWKECLNEDTLSNPGYCKAFGAMYRVQKEYKDIIKAKEYINKGYISKKEGRFYIIYIRGIPFRNTKSIYDKIKLINQNKFI